MSILVILLLVAINSFAQVLLKKGALKSLEGKSFLSNINIYIVTGYLFFFSSTILSVYLLKFINFKSLTIIISLNYVGTLILSNLILKEKYTHRKILSTAIIIIGVLIFNM